MPRFCISHLLIPEVIRFHVITQNVFRFRFLIQNTGMVSGGFMVISPDMFPATLQVNLPDCSLIGNIQIHGEYARTERN